MTSRISKHSRHIATLAIVAFSFAAIMPASVVASEQTRAPGIFAYSMTEQTHGAAPKLGFVSAQRGTGDELDDCMKNPANADQDYIERLGNCFCLATNSTTNGC